MIQYTKYTETIKRQIYELYLNILNLFYEKQMKPYKGFIPFNLKFFNENYNYIKNLDFNSNRLQKIGKNLYRFYLEDNQIFSGTQKIYDKKLEREYEIKNSSNRFIDFSISPFDSLKISDKDYLDNKITYKQLFEQKNILEIFYYYIPEETFFNDSITTNFSEKGRINDLDFNTTNIFNKLRISFKNNINNITENNTDETFDLIFLSYVDNKINIYKISMKQFFEKIESFNNNYLQKVNNNINLFENEITELMFLINIQKNGQDITQYNGQTNFIKLYENDLTKLRNKSVNILNNKVTIRFIFSSEYDIKKSNDFLFIIPYLHNFKNKVMFDPNFLEITPNIRLIHKVDGGQF